MIQTHGVVLEGRVAVGHGGVPRIAGLREEAEVGEPEATHQGQARLSLPGGPGLSRPGVDEHAQEQRSENAGQGQVDRRFPHGWASLQKGALKG